MFKKTIVYFCITLQLLACILLAKSHCNSFVNSIQRTLTFQEFKYNTPNFYTSSFNDTFINSDNLRSLQNSQNNDCENENLCDDDLDDDLTLLSNTSYILKNILYETLEFYIFKPLDRPILLHNPPPELLV